MKRAARELGDLALDALRRELALHPKPGLVTPYGSGSHRDMDHRHFAASLLALEPFFADCVLLGAEGADFAALQARGRGAEAAMMSATGGVNTHRGAIFLLGLLCAAAGGQLQAKGRVQADALGQCVRAHWGAAILATRDQPVCRPSHGQLARLRHGIAGAREQAAAGFPALYDVTLLVLRRSLDQGTDTQRALLQALLSTIAVVADTNLVHRGGPAGLAWAQQACERFVCAGGVLHPGWRTRLDLICEEFVRRSLSPGGSADLLAAAWFVHRTAAAHIATAASAAAMAADSAADSAAMPRDCPQQRPPQQAVSFRALPKEQHGIDNPGPMWPLGMFHARRRTVRIDATMQLCILCSGQGRQSPGMFVRLLDDPLVRASCMNLARALGADTLEKAADPQRCFINANAQPLICLYQMSIWQALNEAGIAPTLAVGYSVGEVSAWGVAGALAPAAVLATAVARAAAMDASSPADAGLLAIRGLRMTAIECLAEEQGAAVAIRNGEDHAIVAGPRAALDAIERALRGTPAHVVRLPISVPAHSRFLAGAAAPFRRHLESLFAAAPRCPVLAGIDGQPRHDFAQAVIALSRQVAEPIHWADMLDIAVELGTTVFFELGPGHALCRMVHDRFPHLEARAFDEFASAAGAIAWLRQRAAALDLASGN